MKPIVVAMPSPSLSFLSVYVPWSQSGARPHAGARFFFNGHFECRRIDNRRALDEQHIRRQMDKRNNKGKHVEGNRLLLRVCKDQQW